jgi:hypothetical protein
MSLNTAGDGFHIFGGTNCFYEFTNGRAFALHAQTLNDVWFFNLSTATWSNVKALDPSSMGVCDTDESAASSSIAIISPIIITLIAALCALLMRSI